MTTVAIVYYSGYGHTAVVAEAVAEGVARAHATPKMLKIESLTQDFTALLDEAGKADAIIFGSPTYMGDVSAPFKAFADASSKVWYAQGWKDKIAGGFTNSLSMSGDKLHTLQSMSILAMQQGMIWVGLGMMPGNMEGNKTSAPEKANRISAGLGAMTQSDNAGPDVTPPEGDKETARILGERIAKITAQFKKGA